MKRPNKGIKRSKDGSMPFVAIAVVLLILASAYGIMISQAKDIEETAENIVTELDSLDSAITITETFVERGLGEIIFDISTDPEGGTLDERAKTFEKRSGDWMRSNFPRADRGVSVTVRDFDFILEAELLKMTSSDTFTEGFTPSYLKATGHYTAHFISGSGTVLRTTMISTDGTCALPLVAEQGSLFEIMVSGEGSALSQIMTQQLTSLAQFRVLNGYGALGEFGNMGTMSILTADDIKTAYDNSLDILNMLVFRCAPEGLDTGMEHIDLADLLIAEDGRITVDLSAVYSQALISIMDDLVLKWFDYLYGNVVIDIMDSSLDGLANAWDSLKGFFTGKNEFSAAPYIERVMSDNDLDINLYRHLFSGKTASISIPEMNVELNGKSVKIPSMLLCPNYPSVDLMSWEGISKFKSNYREGTNEIREWMRNIINSAAVMVGSSKALGTIVVPIDQADDETFMETVYKAVDTALKGGESEVNRILTSAISEQSVSDPFYSAIFKVISDDRDRIYGTAAFRENIRSAAMSALTSYLDSTGIAFDDNDLNKAADAVLGSSGAVKAVSDYESAVDGCLSGLSALTLIPAGKSGIIKDICTGIFGAGVLFTDMATNVPDRIRTLCREAADNMDINAYSGIIDLPGTDSFRLVGSNDSVSVEKMTVSSKTSPSIKIGGPNDNLSDCIHYVGFNENTGASYATVFSVKLEDHVEYSVKSSGRMESSMNISDSEYKGAADVRIDIKIVVASGWELAGVKAYKPSNTLLSDVWNALIKLLSPLLEPLRKVMSIISDTLSILNSALIQMAKYVAAVVEKLFDALMSALEMLADFIENTLEKFFNSVLESAVEAVQKAIGQGSVSFSFMGFTLTFAIKPSTLVNETKTLLTVTLEGMISSLKVTGSVTVKQLGSGANKKLALIGNASVTGNEWNISAEIDPLMRTTSHIIVMTGRIFGVAFDIILPDTVQYQHVHFALSDVPGLGLLLSNIPLPIPGLKASVDAGLDLKYSLPFKTGVMINEFELNPPGEDRDNEWVELYNSTKSTVDMDGYTIHAGSGPDTKVYRITDMALAPGKKEIVYLPGLFLNNSGSALIPDGECVILISPDGKEADRTPVKKDAANDGRTWQRVSDGALEWAFAEGTPGTSNCGGLFSEAMMKTQIVDILKNSVTKAMENMKALKSTGDLAGLFDAAMKGALDSGIEMLASCLVEASIFVSLEITDLSSTLCAGVLIALTIYSDFIEEGLKSLIGEIESLLLNIENPYGIKPLDVLINDLYLGVTFYVGIKPPFFLKNIDLFPSVKMGIQINANMASFCTAIGLNRGEWKVTAGVVILNCPALMIPSSQNASVGLESDIWLLRATFHSA